MIYRFGKFCLDTARQELRHGADPVETEPMALALLQHLIEHRERLVPKDELFQVLWQDRAVSDSALSTCIKSARRAVGDTGAQQATIRTVHGKGLRWVAALDQADTLAETDLDHGDNLWIEAARGPSLAILPFGVLGGDARADTLSAAIPHELIVAIARLRWISVTARGSSFCFGSDNADLGAVRRQLGVRYCVTGHVELIGSQLAVSVELADTENGQVIWAERFNAALEDVHEIRQTIVAEVVFAAENQIPQSEAAKARLQAPENIDAWATYHLGLQSLYRFDVSENDRAQALFNRAITLEPDFARAHAALSFTHFKTAFMHYGSDRDRAVNAAQAAAERAVELDAMDPFANFSMGRSLWLTGDLSGAQGWLGRSTALSPSFAQGLYARAWTETVAGSCAAGRRLSDEARRLSPLDPMLYAMLGTRALALAQEGRDDEAADWATQAAHAPGAHDLIRVLAVAVNEMAGDGAAAAHWVQRLQAGGNSLTQERYFRSFPFADADFRARFSAALSRHGIS